MRRLILLVTGLLVLLGALWAPAAHAQDERISSFDIAYDVQPDGTIDVRLEMDWHFGETGRHGIEHDLIIQEPWDDDDSQDARQEITDIQVSSPSGAPAQFTQQEVREGDEGVLRLRIGDPDVTLDTEDATYVINYTVEGGMRTFDGVPELFVDAVSDGQLDIDRFSAAVTGPEGVQQSRCLIGGDECSTEISGGIATYAAENVTEPLSVVASFPEGSVSNAEPILVEAGGREATPLTQFLIAAGAALVSILTTVGFRLFSIRRDERYVNVPPTLTDRGGPVKRMKRLEVPVQFHPPSLPVHEAGVLLERKYDSTQLAAALVDLAVQDQVILGSDPLMVKPAGRPVTVGEPGATLVRHASEEDRLPTENAYKMGDAMAANAKRVLNSSGYFGKDRPNAGLLPMVVPWVLWFAALIAFVAFGNYMGLALWALIGVAVGSGLGVAASMMLPHQGRPLTAEGTAKLDEIEGFRTYLATAEAEQLNVEAEQDIFRKYLPWAVLYGLTDRWVRVCRQLASMGRIAPVDTSFWQGDGSFDSGIKRFRDDTRKSTSRPSSSGGGRSGGRSGLSRGSRGGGGSGGSRSRSW